MWRPRRCEARTARSISDFECTGFRFDGGSDVVDLGPGTSEEQSLYYVPVFAHANAALARTGGGERWRRDGGSWMLLDPERAAVLERLGFHSFDRS